MGLVKRLLAVKKIETLSKIWARFQMEWSCGVNVTGSTESEGYQILLAIRADQLGQLQQFFRYCQLTPRRCLNELLAKK